MFCHLLLAQALAAEPTETTGSAAGNEATTTAPAVRAARARPPYEARSRTWFGGVVPALASRAWVYEGELVVDLAIGSDVNVRFGTPSGWVQPELRVYTLIDPSLFSGWGGAGALLGARFGKDRGWYAGVGAGVGTVYYRFIAHAWLGYAFRIGDFGRVSPELSLGTTSTITCRFEWSVTSPRY